MQDKQRDAIASRIVKPGRLLIGRQDGKGSLTVPLKAAGQDGASSESLHVFEGGLLWEGDPYSLSFCLSTTEPIRRATLCVNDHDELRTRARHQMVVEQEERWYQHSFEVDRDPGNFYANHPFSLTCGFARVDIRIVFCDGEEALLVTPDIVTLDEPAHQGQTGESAEEGNVREMYRSLTRAQDNQAAEWMFADETTQAKGQRLSSDDDTDWAYAPITARLDIMHDTLDCVYQAFYDPRSSFPNELPEPEQRKRDARDTDENRAVLALLVSMEEQVRGMRTMLHEMLAESSRLHEALRALLQKVGARRGTSESLPALELIVQHKRREEELCDEADKLWRYISHDMTFIHDPHNGFSAVEKIAFRVPGLVEPYISDPSYAALYDAMRSWERCIQLPPLRRDVTLHAIKPDRLFEYSVLHKMLDWLWRSGFEEDLSAGAAIVHYEYELADWYDKYQNEERAANTYHLVRTNGREKMRVDLYYQPVLYLGDLEENGITLHRVPRIEPAPDEHDGRFWTPDFLLVVRDADDRRNYLIDAKYCSAKTLRGKLDDCFDKYAARTAVDHGRPGTGIDGVMVAAGRLDAPSLEVQQRELGETTIPCAIAPFHTRIGRAGMTKFFSLLGIDG